MIRWWTSFFASSRMNHRQHPGVIRSAAVAYIFKLGEALEQHGHEVQYFGMEHEGRCVGNRVNAYTSDMDFHGGSKLSKLTYPIKTIYSKEARVQLRKVLDETTLVWHNLLQGCNGVWLLCGRSGAFRNCGV